VKPSSSASPQAVSEDGLRRPGKAVKDRAEELLRTACKAEVDKEERGSGRSRISRDTDQL